MKYLLLVEDCSLRLKPGGKCTKREGNAGTWYMPAQEPCLDFPGVLQALKHLAPVPQRYLGLVVVANHHARPGTQAQRMGRSAGAFLAWA